MIIEKGILSNIDPEDIQRGTFIVPEGVTEISANAFYNLKNLRHVILPSSLEVIGENAFLDCKKLLSVEFSEGINLIENGAFANCYNLTNVKIPDSVKIIGDECFQGCKRLETIKLPNELRTISARTFNECESLLEIELPDTVTKIEEEAFVSCNNLKSIKLNNGLESIGGNAFLYCDSLEQIEIPDSVTYIDNGAFCSCTRLSEAKLSNSLEDIPYGLFSQCVNLKHITLPDSIKILGPNAFSNCSSLESIDFSKNLTYIGSRCFESCNSLKNISLPKSLKNVENGAFLDCSGLKCIKFYDELKHLDQHYLYNPLPYLNKEDGFFTLSTEQGTEFLPTEKLNINVGTLAKYWDKKDIILNEQKNENVALVYNSLLWRFKPEHFREFMDSHNFTFIKKLNINPNAVYSEIANSFKFLYNLGTMDSPEIDENGKPINHAQKVYNFLDTKIKQRVFDDFSFGDCARKMKLTGYKKEFSEFFMKYFDEIIAYEKTNPNFIAKCYNEFEEVQKTNTNNHGSQRQLKATFKKFVDYFAENKFKGINEETKEIADTISPYFSEQKSFNIAVKIDKERKEKNIPNNILGFHLKEENPFAQIDEFSDAIKNEQTTTAHNLTSAAINEFSYEWLEKNDPKNFILGKLCNCCAHIEGHGQGIMRASIIHPNIQNLVIRDKNNFIITKSTLFINPEKGYGVFNNVEVSNFYNDLKSDIYEKYILGIKDFVNHYNKQHPDKPINVITVGMHLNDLEPEIVRHHKKSKELYDSIDFSTYDLEGFGHPGDSSKSQYILWKNEETKKKKETKEVELER
ncbi:MAG: leucine-rich repeat domain-containing protein [Clostridia bacterium]|nr:leucine-rich repeat domain-containing protein [Clostridia bacterium]